MTISSLNSEPYQIQVLLAQVWRQGFWVSLPILNVQGALQIGSASTITLNMTPGDNDPDAILYEGERIRIYRGILGSPLQRCFTGFVDACTATNSVAGTVRSVVVSDHFKELKDAKLLQPRVYDNVEPNLAVADCINQALTTGQLKLFDDAGNALVSDAFYDQANGNSILDAPQIFNDDGSVYSLPQGKLNSTMTVQNASASIQIPPASGSLNYIVVDTGIPYMIASTMSANFVLNTNAANFPPASGQYFLDPYNGLAYFNRAAASTYFRFATFHYDAPLFGFQLGSSIGDVVQSIMDKTGQHLIIDNYGKFHVIPNSRPHVPTRILGKDQYIQNAIQTNRDRSNVIICEGWDGNCGTIIASKAILLQDTLAAPPAGLGKRSYLIVQDPTWTTQYAANKAAYYAAKQVGRRGKVMSLTILDDVSIAVNDTIAFIGTFPEVSTKDFFIVEQVSWQLGIVNNKQVSQSVVSGTLIPAQNTVYLGPASAVTGAGNVDYSVDVQPIFNCNLSPAGGTTASSFSITSGLDLQFTVASQNVQESIDIYGSDGSHYIAENNVPRAGGARYSLPLPSGAFTAGVFYVIELWTLDQYGNVGAYRDCITALP